jgi:hypothetical protein
VQPNALIQAVGSRFEELHLLIEGAAFVHRHLNEHAIPGPVDIEVGVSDEIAFGCSVTTWKRSLFGAFKGPMTPS